MKFDIHKKYGKDNYNYENGAGKKKLLIKLWSFFWDHVEPEVNVNNSIHDSTYNLNNTTGCRIKVFSQCHRDILVIY